MPTHPQPLGSVLFALDRSASMAAHDVLPSRLEHAKALARARIAGLPAGTRVAVVAFDRSATPLTSVTHDHAAAVRALAAIEQTDAAADLLPAAQLALAMLADEPRAQLVLLSDGNLQHGAEAAALLTAAGELGLEHVAVGKSARNVAITRLAQRPYPLDRAHQECLVALTNFGDQREPLRLQVQTPFGLLHDEALVLEPHQSATRTLVDLPSSEAALEARLLLQHGPDALATDDHAWSSTVPRKRTRTLLVSPGNRYLEAALLLADSLELHTLPPAEYRDTGGYDVVIFDGVLPASPPAAAALYLGPIGLDGAFPLARGELVERPFFDHVERRHPLLSELSWADVNVARARRLTVTAADHVLAESQGSGVVAPLIVEGERAGLPFVALSFGLTETDLPLRAAFPLFVLRVLDRLAQRGEAVSSSQLAGERLTLAVPGSLAELTLRGPASAPRPLRVESSAQGSVVRTVIDRAGSYTLHGNGFALPLAINVAAEHESQLAPRPGLLPTRPPRARPASSAAQARARSATVAASESPLAERSWLYLAGCALALLTLEWLTFQRRWTV